MLDVEIPPDAAGTPVIRSFRACLASVLELSVEDVPRTDGDLGGAVSEWRTWLAGRDVGLVPVAGAPSFQWPGFWIAVLGAAQNVREETAVLMFGTPPGVVLSPQDPRLLGRAAARLPVRDGFVVSAFDPAVAVGVAVPAAPGVVEAIAIATRAEAPMRRVETVRALPGRGLEGDRYAKQAGTFTPRDGRRGGYDLTLVEAEVLDQLALPGGDRLAYAESRRNIVTRGIDLNALVGRRFTIGDVECVGRRLCEPCAHLERLTHPGVLRSLIHKGGLRADILTEGQIAEGARVGVIDEFPTGGGSTTANGSTDGPDGGEGRA
jgi:MOSC domain-containing protein YiiM